MFPPHAARLLGLIPASVVVTVAASAVGEGSRFSLEWSAPPGCPNEAAIRARIETLLGTSVEALARGPILVRGTVTADATHAEVHLETSVPNERTERAPGGTAEPGEPDTLKGERTIRGASCNEVSAAGALVIALAIDAKAVAEHEGQGATLAFETPPPTPAATPTPTVATAPPTLNPPLPPPIALTPPPPRARLPTEGLFEATLVGDLGSLPAPSIGTGLGAGFSRGRFATHLDVAYFFPRFAAAPPSADGRSRGADVSLVAIDLDGCYVVVPGLVEVDACGALETGVLLAEGKRFERTTSAIAPWLGVLGTIGLVVRPLAPVTVRVGVGALVSFGRSRIRFSETVGNSEQFPLLHRPSPVSGRASLGAGLSF